MKCSEVRKVLSQYMDGMINGKKREKVEEHLASCHSCTEELKALREVRENLEQLGEVDVPANFLDMIHARIEQESPVRRLWRRLFTPTGRRIPLELAAAVSMIVVVILLLRVLPLTRPPRREQIPIELAEVPQKSEKEIDVDDSYAPVPETDLLIKKKTEREDKIEAVGKTPESWIGPESQGYQEFDDRSEQAVQSGPSVSPEPEVSLEPRAQPESVTLFETPIQLGDKEKAGLPTIKEGESPEDIAHALALEATGRPKLRILLALPPFDKNKAKSGDRVSVKQAPSSFRESERGSTDSLLDEGSRSLVSVYERIEELVGRSSGNVVSSHLDRGITAEIPAMSYEQFLEELSRIGRFEQPELHEPLDPTDIILLSITVSP